MNKNDIDENKIEGVIDIMFSADGGCQFCVSRLLVQLINRFPEYEKFVREKFVDQFGCEIEEIEK